MHAACANELSIGQLRLQCSAAQRPVVLDALDAAAWPTADAHQVLILRRLEVNAEAWAIGREAATLLRRLLDTAMCPWTQDTAQAVAVRFEGPSDHLAALCTEWLRSPASPAWFFQHHALARQVQAAGSPGEGLLLLLSEQILQLPAVFAQLQRHGALHEVLRALEPLVTQTLIERLLLHTGFPLRSARSFGAIPALPAEPAPPPGAVPTVPLSLWQQALHNLPTRQRSPLATLGAILLAWQHTPHLLASAEHAPAFVARLRMQLLGEEASLPHAESSPVPPSPLPTQSRLLRREGKAARPGEPRPQPVLADQHIPSAQPPAAESTPQQLFHTRHGGFFCLLNLLRMVPAPAPGDSSAWQHLYLLCRTLGIQLDRPLLGFIAAQLQLEDPAELESLQPTDYDKHLLQQAGLRFDHLGFWPHGLLQRLARVRHDPVQIDIDFHVDTVDLDIRLAGLDIDPRWQPWLGRVVHFHYLDDPQLRPGGET